MNTFTNREQGSTLIVTIILVLLLTILGLGGIAVNSTQTRIATNAADSQIAFQTAEGALRLVQSGLLSGTYPKQNFLANSGGLYLLQPSNAPLWKTIDWSSSSDVISGFQGSSSSPSKFFIEQLPSVVPPGTGFKTPQSISIYRVTARAVGASGGSPVILQDTIRIQ